MTNISHELKTPLTVMSGYAQVTIKQMDEGTVDQGTRENLKVISREAMRLANLARELTETIPENAKIKYEDITIDTVLKEISKIGDTLLARHNNILVINIDKDLPILHINHEMIKQLLLNLLANANRHTENGIIKITVTNTEDDDFISITVSDNGSGIPKSLIPHAFERNVSGDGSSGVGLAICKDIVEHHGGTITIENRIKKGTVVRFTLPTILREEDGQ